MKGVRRDLRQGFHLRLVLVCSAASLLSGCLVIPMNKATHGSRQNVSEEAVAGFQKGVTTRQDVVLALGEPDWVARDESCYGYHWSRVRWVWLIVASNGYSGGAIGGDVTREGHLKVTFDADDRLQGCDLTKTWGGDSTLGSDVAVSHRPPQGNVFSVELHPRVHGANDIGPEARPEKVKVLQVIDNRLESGRIGEFKSLGAKIGDIHGSRSVVNYLREELAAEVEATGHSIVAENADLIVQPLLTRIWISTESTLAYFDVVAEVECNLMCKRADGSGGQVARSYSGRSVKRTYLMPNSEMFATVAAAGMDDLIAKIRRDAIWDAVPRSAESGE